MRMFRRHPKPNRVDPNALLTQAQASIELAIKQQPRVNALTAWLEDRKNQNGFGEDFEYTLRPKGTS